MQKQEQLPGPGESREELGATYSCTDELITALSAEFSYQDMHVLKHTPIIRIKKYIYKQLQMFLEISG